MIEFRHWMTRILLAALWLLSTAGARANDSGESCHQFDTVYPRMTVSVRAEPNLTSQRVGGASRGEALAVRESSQVDLLCWLRIDAGWVVNSFFLRPEPADPVRTTTRTAEVSCYAHERAYVGGSMNIRQRATIDSPVIAKASSGDVFDVVASQRGETWCWLRVAEGWLARTSRVSTTRPVAPPAPVAQLPVPVITEAPHQIINSQGRHIPIYGADSFRLSIAQAFYYLRDNVPHWWPYVAIIDDVKFDAGACSLGYACADWPYKGVYFGNRAIGKSVHQLASTLIHEACHIYQWQEGRGDNYDSSLAWEDRPHEIECMNKEREAGF